MGTEPAARTSNGTERRIGDAENGDRRGREAGNRDAGSLVGRVAAVRQAIDDWRVREHLRRAEHELRARDPGLSPARRRRRRRHLDRLGAYRRRGRFPRNDREPVRTPRFVGDRGRPCAMAALLAADGRPDLVEAVLATDDTVRFEDLDDGHPLVEWVERNGFTRAEAARIQPGYDVGVSFVTDCGPVSCATARLLAGTVGLAVAAALEYVGYRVVGDLFPDNALKRRAVFGYVTVLNLLLGPLVALAAYLIVP